MSCRINSLKVSGVLQDSGSQPRTEQRFRDRPPHPILEPPASLHSAETPPRARASCFQAPARRGLACETVSVLQGIFLEET